jgi:hypothetical protein
MRWLIAAAKYKRGFDPEPNPDCQTWVYGLIDVDRHLLDELRVVLNETETKLRNTPFPDIVDVFQLGYLTNDLINADIPTNGISGPVAGPIPEGEPGGWEYVTLDDNRFVRVGIRLGAVLTDAQRELAIKLIRAHIKQCDEHNRILKALDNKLRRAGFCSTSVRLVRSEAELALAPECSVSIDTDRGFLEVRTAGMLEPDQRQGIGRIAHDYLVTEGINALMGEEFAASPVHVVQHVLSRFHYAARRLRNRQRNKNSLEMADEYDVQDLLGAILEAYFDDVIKEDPNPKWGGKSTRVDLVIKKAKILIEIKRPRMAQPEGDVSDALSADIPHYRKRQDCNTLFCFIFDPDHRITNPTVFKDDVESLGTEDMAVRVIVNQD